jgi:multicomponent Na+:H+ antiporter subunit F
MKQVNMESILLTTLYISLIIHILLIGVSVWRVWRGENVIDRLMGADLISTLTVCILVLIALFEDNSIFIDVAIGLVALGFVSSIALAKYIADEQMF